MQERALHSKPQIKICGLSTPETLEAAIGFGADLVGFVFFAPSPRNLTLDQAQALAQQVAGRAQKVALSVDAKDDDLRAIIAHMQPDLLQLHGQESPERLSDIRQKFGLPVMKAIGISTRADLARLSDYATVSDHLLFDAKMPKDSVLPGGNGRTFDWSILQDLQLEKPWMLSGGLDATNVAEALRQTGAPAVDVSSGVESAPGIKDINKLREFIAALRPLHAKHIP
jgi:phosphoribosylanthranilate isomerase